MHTIRSLQQTVQHMQHSIATQDATVNTWRTQLHGLVQRLYTAVHNVETAEQDTAHKAHVDVV